MKSPIDPNHWSDHFQRDIQAGVFFLNGWDILHRFIMASQPAPLGKSTRPRNSRPYDQGLSTIGFP